MTVVVAIDAGTTGVRAFAVDEHGHAARAVVPRVPAALPAAGLGRARRRRDLARHASRRSAEVAREIDAAGETVAAIGITNQRETTVVWDRRTGAPLHRAIVWQDRRTAGTLRRRCAPPATSRWSARRTGLVLDPYFSATKLAWLLHEGGVAADADSRVRHGRHVDPLAPHRRHRRRRARDRSVEREPHDALRHRRAATGPTSSARCSTSRARACPRCCRRAAASARRAPTARRAHGAGQRHRRRPAGRAVRAGVLRARHGQEHVRHRLVRAHERRAGRCRNRSTACSRPSRGRLGGDRRRTRWKARSS